MELVREFFRLASGQRAAILFSVGTLTVATLSGLVPPAATKGLIDYVLGDMPLPDRWVKLGLPTDRWHLLVGE